MSFHCVFSPLGFLIFEQLPKKRLSEWPCFLKSSSLAYALI
ncbi:hypothetical protein SpAn4DRAFT_1534 [Sporomusa ovata]|uniref:Uncharacterized protein n=1 Tax=Sporomusa ovata TaxID=2378 RepID=A0A0U1KTI1_9FIRM|nr:hypothetical protein SpAn4DRAFT_1534 [Sporomusa ovata]